MQSIIEFLVKKKAQEIKHKYKPTTRFELIDNINEIIDNNEGKDLIDLNIIDVSIIEDFRLVFTKVKNKKLNFDVSHWEVSNAKNMAGMFYELENFNCDISGWDTSKVEDMLQMFYGCKKFDCDISKWDVSNVMDFQSMFVKCYQFNQDLNKWNVNKNALKKWMFDRCPLQNNPPEWYK